MQSSQSLVQERRLQPSNQASQRLTQSSVTDNCTEHGKESRGSVEPPPGPPQPAACLNLLHSPLSLQDPESTAVSSFLAHHRMRFSMLSLAPGLLSSREPGDIIIHLSANGQEPTPSLAESHHPCSTATEVLYTQNGTRQARQDTRDRRSELQVGEGFGALCIMWVCVLHYARLFPL